MRWAPQISLICFCFVSSIDSILMGSIERMPETVISPCAYKQDQYDKSGIVVDCRTLGLREVKPEWFPSFATEVYLDGNLLQYVSSDMFGTQVNPRLLSLGANRIRFIAPDAFRRFSRLEFLNIEDNLLCLANLSDHIFQNLRNLTTLQLAYNNILSQSSAWHYPRGLLQGLNELRSLTLQIFPGDLDFRDLFQNISALENLLLTGDVNVIKNESFACFERIPLRSLKLRLVYNLQRTEPNAFRPLTHLQDFNLAITNQGVKRSLESLYALQNRNFTSLNFYSVTSVNMVRFGLSSSAILDVHKTRFLSNICIKHFSLTSSRIIVIEPGVFMSSTWRNCIESIDLSGNPLLGEKLTLFEVPSLQHLRSVTIKDCKYSLFKTKPPTAGNYANRYAETTDSKLKERRRLARSYLGKPESYLNRGKLILPFSPFMESFTYSGCSDDAGDVTGVVEFKNAKNMRSMDLSDNGFGEFTAEIKGLTNIESLDLSYNSLNIISETLFDTLSSLKTLKLAGVSLNESFMFKNSARLFKSLSKLEILDLSSNEISLMQSEALTHSSGLREIDLSKNKLQRLSLDLSSFNRLQRLNLSYNSFTYLTEKEINSLEKVHESIPSMSLYLAGNPFSCDCSHIRFLSWMSRTTIRLDRGRDYPCVDDRGNLVSTGVFLRDLEALWRRCHGVAAFYVSVVLWLLLLLAFTFAYFIRHFETFLKHALLRAFVPGFEFKRPADYRYGVFLGYADDDFRFACFDLARFFEEHLKVTTYIRDRDLLPSTDMAESIIEAVDSSWRIVLLITDCFLRDEGWSYFTAKMAVHSINPLNPKRVVLIVQDQIFDQIPETFLKGVPDENIIVVKGHFRLGYEQQQALKYAIHDHK